VCLGDGVGDQDTNSGACEAVSLGPYADSSVQFRRRVTAFERIVACYLTTYLTQLAVAFGMVETMGRTTDVIRVLHVDDEPAFADLVATYLGRQDDRFEVETATTVGEGLDRLADSSIDCVVSDHDMPDRNGIDFLETVRERYPSLPFILYTGKGSEEVASDAISAGVTDYLQKDSGTSQYAVLANRIRNAVDTYYAQVELADREQRLNLFFEQSPLGVIEWTDDFEFARCNGAAEDILGYSERELVGNSWETIVPPSEQDAVSETVSGLLENDSGFHSTNENVRRDGERIVCEWHNRVVTDETGAVVTVFSQFRDVTEREERKRELERYEAYLQEPTDIVTVLDSSGVVRYESPPIERILGYDPSELVGENAFDYVHPDEVESLLTTFDDLVSEPGGQATVECRFRAADRDWTWLEIRGTNRLEQDPINGIVTNNRDITDRKAHERERERKERRYKAVLDDPHILVALLDTDGTVLDLNETAMGYVDATVAELRGQPYWETPQFEQSAAVSETVRDRIEQAADGTYVEFDADLVRPNGAPYSIEGVVRPVTDDDGEVVSLLVSERDITERKEYKRDFERIRTYFTEAERLGSLGAWELGTDGSIEWTRGTRRIHEVDEAFDPTLEDGLSFFHPDDRGRVERAVTKAMDENERYDVRARLITAAGNERWVRTPGTPVADGETAVRGYIQDITEQRERQRELRDANAQLEAAVSAGSVGTWLWNLPDDRIRMGPEFARTFGVDPDDARVGVPLERFTSSIHEADRERVEADIDAAVESCSEYQTEYRIRDADDEVRWVIARGHVECDADGTPVRFPGVLIDITDRKASERQLERQNERLDEFTSIVSHDLRNPLNVASGKLDLAREDCDSDHLADAERALERMDDLVDDLLTVARQGQPVTDPALIDLERIVTTCWTNVDTADATLSIEVDRLIRADRTRLKQLFENLIRNAVEHGGSTVTVTVGELDDGFYVADDGAGIDDADRSSVFDAGYSTDDDGTGFGLNIVAQVADAHGWDVDVTEAAAGGARFEVTGVGVVETDDR
jgi:PAS domain S-box-containing protein